MKKLVLFIFLLGIVQLNAQEGKEEVVFTLVEETPEFPGGMEAMKEYLALNINYPKKARDNKEEGTVYITFVVDRSGSVKDVKVLRGVSEAIDKEAIRVIMNMPDWKPGKQRGKPVNVQFNVPVKFSL